MVTLEELLEDWKPKIDLGNGHWFAFCGWHPDRELNPQYAHLADVEKYGGIHIHPRPDGNGYCEGSITFDTEAAREISKSHPRWTVHSFDPLTLSPSLLCRACGSHGFIRNGKWEGC